MEKSYIILKDTNDTHETTLVYANWYCLTINARIHSFDNSGSWLREITGILGLTQKQVAEYMQVSVRRVQDMYKSRELSDDNILKISELARSYGYSVGAVYLPKKVFFTPYTQTERP